MTFRRSPDFFLFRGGCWVNYAPVHVRSAYSGGHAPSFLDNGIGFRGSRENYVR